MGPTVLLWYDVEDYITEESDDALLALIEMMEQRGVRGTFKLVGEKARVLQARGRNDILDKLMGQGIGYHTDMHSEHPTISEYCDPLGFAEGAAEFERREAGGLADLRRTLPRPVSTYGQPGAAWAAQAFPALRKWGVPTYVDSNDMIDLDGGPFWYCGILTLTLLPGIMRMELEDWGLENAVAQFDSLLANGENLISIFYHPCEFSTVEFWDGVNFSRGMNTPRSQWKRSRLREPGQMEHYVEMLGRFIDHMLARGSRFITTDELTGNVGFGNPDDYPAVTMEDVRELAGRWRGSANYEQCRGSWLCASEAFTLMRAALCGDPLKPFLAYGPERPATTEDGAGGTLGDYRLALASQWRDVMGTPQLPDSFVVNSKRVNPVDMACTVAHILSAQPPEDRFVPAVRGTLAPERHISSNRDFGGKWIIFPEDFMVDRLLETARLQAWTLKPAVWVTQERG